MSGRSFVEGLSIPFVHKNISQQMMRAPWSAGCLFCLNPPCGVDIIIFVIVRFFDGYPISDWIPSPLVFFSFLFFSLLFSFFFHSLFIV